VILCWFFVIGTLGLTEIVRTPRVLAALSPHYIVTFFAANTTSGFLVLGAVFLVVTGGETLYADIGHFGKRPIRLTWFGIVLPALVLNYMGQGALLLRDAGTAKNPFYHLAPGWLQIPLIFLATAATVIASQAVISGAFSLTRQAVHLGYSPRMTIEHTSEEEAGQVYIGAVNWMLFAAAVGLVVAFGSSGALAGAYGVAITTTMVITTLLLSVVARDLWRWSFGLTAVVAAALLLVDLSFFGANLFKVSTGGWFPLLVAGVLFTLMSTWRRGRQLVDNQLYESRLSIENFLANLNGHRLSRTKGVAVFLTGNPQGTPSALLQNVKHNGVLHERVVLLSVSTRGVPYVPRKERLKIDDLGHGFWRVQAGYGFMQTPSVPRILALARAQGVEVKLAESTFFLSRKIPIATHQPGMAVWRERLFSLMSRNSQAVTTYFDIPADKVVEIGMPIEI
jgi:KUP system potassium uptake protein